MNHTVTDGPDPSVTDHVRRYRHYARLATRPIPVVGLDRIEEQR
ncbi:hypothetical protein ACWF82_04265 [Nocardia sp. NPDC055053]